MEEKNNYRKYQADLAEWIKEKGERAVGAELIARREKTFDSYPKNIPVKHCSICREPLIFHSSAYEEGYHYDGCI